MKRFLAFILLTGIFPASLYALGLGKLDLKSGLNEPFEATIELLSPTRDELDSLTLRLADAEAFERARIDRPFVLSQLRFEVEESEAGPDRVRVYSREAMREPFLNFLVEANWSHGRLFREYTVLLDPPLYDAGVSGRHEPVVPSAAPKAAEPVAEETPVAPVSGGAAEGAPGGYAGGDYGPTAVGDTLWSIAGRTRPDANTTVQQMMLALVRANPDAFVSDNVNGLKRGQILHMPSQEDLAAVAPADAFAQVKAEYAAWQQAGGAMPAATPERPVGTENAAASAAAQPVSAAPTAAPAEGKSQLKLVTPTQQATGAAQGAGPAPGAAGGKQDESLALASEQVEALSQENLELKDRLTESQTIVDDLKRLIALKDDELAALQQKLAAGGEAAQPPAPAEAAKQAEPVKAAAEPAPAAAAPPVEAPGEAAAPPPEQAKEQKAAPQPKPVAEEKPAPAKTAPPPAPVEPSSGLLDQLPAIVTGNIQLIAMVAGGLFVIVVLMLLVARRRRQAAEEGEAVTLEFPDFKGPEAETILPGGEAEEEEIEVERSAPEPAPAAKAPPKARAETAAAPAAKPAPAKAAAAAEEVPAAPQEDPLAEVNVFLAYEHFDQAEEFVRDAINREPDNLDFHVKLLEVLSAANERKKYEEAAKVLHDKVNGAGAYWETALFYWDAMSPGRALFAAPVAGEEEAPAAAAAGGGMLDLTAGESAKPAQADLSLDFDLGEATAAPAPKPAATPREEEVLDITAGTEGAASIPAAPAAEDVLDVTAAVGLNAIEPSGQAGGGEAEDEILDLSQSGGEDLLDVTAHADLESADLKEDLLDVTTATGAGADADDLLAVSTSPAKAADEGALDFDLNLGGGAPAAEPAPEPSARPDNVIEFDGSGAGGHDKAESLDLDFTAGGTSAGPEDEGGLELDLSADSGEPGAAGELSLESPIGEGGLELDIGGDDSSALEFELDEGGESDKGAAAASLELEAASLAGDSAAPGDDGFELDLSVDEPQAAEPEIDMEGTVEVKKLDLSTDEDEDDEDRTVFVPRTKDAQEQTAEDEIATKLDLAKAYVELGDKDSAKAILKEVMTDGNPQQKRQAQELIKQMS